MDSLSMLFALGGSGENGRNCYLLKTPSGSILLDCGVKRIVSPEHIGEYPKLTPEIVSDIKAVFLSHAHEDHCAGLPLLYALGYTGWVYGSQETIDAAPQMIRKWMAFVLAQGGTLPFRQEDAQRVQFAPLALGAGSLCGMRILTGRSGHTAGSMWIALGWEKDGYQLFYSGDMCTCAASLACDMPPACDHAVLNCAYAGQVLDQNAQYDTLTQAAIHTLAGGGKLLLPVPPTGRGCDMLLHLAQNIPHAEIHAAKSIIANTRAMLENTKWLCGSLPHPSVLDGVHVLGDADDYTSACKGRPAILLVTDGMLTTAEGLACFHLLKGGAANRVIISGHAAPGTAGGNLLDSAWRMAHGVAMKADKMVIKVHLDDYDALNMHKHLQAKETILFHAPAQSCESIIRAYAHAGAHACCLTPEEALTL